MHSIEAALARDFARRGAVVIPLVFLAMFTVPHWLFELLDFNRTLSPTAHEAIVLHVTLTLTMGFGAAVAVFQAQGQLARFFVRPISATRLVACQMTLGIATIAMLYLAAVGLLNLRGAEWPLLGPAMFLAATLACAMAAIWSLEGTVVGQVVGATATSVPLVIWFSRCYGATLFGNWHVMWRSPTAVETLTLGGITVAAYVLAVVGVSRTRRGDLWDFAALQAWWERQWSRGDAATPFSGPQAAQLWSEWREKLGPAPACLVAFAILAAMGSWTAGWMPTEELVSFTFGMPIVLLLVVGPFVYGLVAGNCSREGKTGMKYLLATRPVTDGFLAQTILRHCSAALFLALGTWLVGLLAVGGLAYLSGHRAGSIRSMVPTSFDQVNPLLLAIVLIPLASWTFTTLMATLSAAGRPWLWLTVLFGVLGLGLTLGLTKEFLAPPTFEIVAVALLVLGGGLYLAGTAWAFVAAVRRRLISFKMALRAAAAWFIVSTVMAFIWPPPLALTGVWLWHGVGFVALSILPFAALPLAIRWNRHR